MPLPISPNSWLFIAVAIAIVWVAFSVMSSSQRRSASRTGEKACPGCGATQPAFANFCRRCGRRL